MSLKDLSSYTIYSRYAHYIPELKRRETWDEIVERVFGMHERKYAEQLASNEEFKKEFLFAKDAIKKKKVLGSQRALQYGGENILKKNERIYNCSGLLIDKNRAFQDCSFLLLAGCGVGISVQKHHIEKLSKIQKPQKGNKVFQIPDSIEGWSDAIGVLISSYCTCNPVFEEYQGYNIEFDYSIIRKKGSLIAKNFLAPGPEPLKNGINKIREVLDRCSKSGFLRPIDAFDIVMHIANFTVSGGLRRSAVITLFSKDDEEMIKAKTGDWYITNPQRARSNNSVILRRDNTTKEEFLKIYENVKQFGEPGFYWVDDDLASVTNPCQPASATLLTPNGISTFGDLKEGDKIWSESGWTTVVKKWSTGIKPVYKWITDGYSESLGEYSYFIGTENHRVVSNGQKIEISQTKTVDFFNDDGPEGVELDPVCIMNCNITDIEYLGEQEVFDITVDNEQHTYWTGGLNVSNCCEIGFWPMLETGETGVSFCNLVEINGKNCISAEVFYDLCRAATIIGTLQAGYNSFPYLGGVTEQLARKEALVGVSLTGWMENPQVLFDEGTLKNGAKICKEVNERIARFIGINPAARLTCCKPSGSSSCILQTSSGIHPHHSRRYIRNVQVNKQEFAGQYYKQINPTAVEESVWSTNKTDDVISFSCEVPKGSILKNDISAIDFLKKIKLVQNSWVLSGTVRERGLNSTITNNVSNTCVIRDEQEWKDVANFIYDNRQYFSGISLLSATGDLDYRQAPFTTVLTDKEIVEKYGNGSLLASGLIVDGIQAFNGDLYSACEAVLGITKLADQKEVGEEPKKPSRKDYKSEKQYSSALVDYSIQLNIFFQNKGEYEDLEQKYDWVRRAKQFAERYFNGDIKLMTYCLKHVDIWKRYLDINREHKEIDWSKVTESRQEIVAADTMGAIACNGNSCSLTI